MTEGRRKRGTGLTSGYQRTTGLKQPRTFCAAKETGFCLLLDSAPSSSTDFDVDHCILPFCSVFYFDFLPWMKSVCGSGNFTWSSVLLLSENHLPSFDVQCLFKILDFCTMYSLVWESMREKEAKENGGDGAYEMSMAWQIASSIFHHIYHRYPPAPSSSSMLTAAVSFNWHHLHQSTCAVVQKIPDHS